MAANDTEKLRHLAALILAELAIEREAKAAFKAWLPTVLDAVLHGKVSGVQDSLTAAVNPDSGENTRDAWEAAIAGLLFAIGKIFDAQFSKITTVPRAQLDTLKANYVASVRTRLSAIPDEVVKQLREVVAKGVRDGVTEEQMARRITEALQPRLRVYVDRAKKIARTEAISVYNAGRHQAYLQLQRETGQQWTKTWLSVRDTRVRHTHATADGQKVGLGAQFSVGGFACDYPGDPRLPAAEAVNCRCVAIYAGTLTNGEKMTPIVAAILASIEEYAAAKDGHLPNGWRGVMAPLNRPTGDNRQLNVPEGGLRTRELPVSFRWQPAAIGGHDGAVMTGRVDRVWAEDINGAPFLMGEGAIDVHGQNGSEYARQLAEGFAMFVSVDPDEVTFETQFFDEAGNQVPFGDAVTTSEGVEALKPGYSAVDVMTDWRFAGVTGVSIPAFQEARIEPVYGYQPKTPVAAALDEGIPSQAELFDMLDAAGMDNEGDLLELARALKNRRAYDALTDYEDADGIVATVVGSLSFPVFPKRDRKWDGHVARQNVEKWASSDGSGDLDKINWTKFARCFLYRGAPQSGNSLVAAPGDKPKSAYRVEDFKLGFVDIIDGKPYIVANGAIGIAGGHGVTATRGIPAAEVKAIKSKLCSLYAKVRTVHKDFPECPFKPGSGGQTALYEEPLTAAAGQVFNLEAFENPGFTAPTPLTVKDGRVFGHVALFDSCYMAQGGARTCIKPPKGNDYSRFLAHGARLADGSILPVGMITFGEGHFAGGSLKASMANYANLATGAAKVNCGEDEFGVWVAGEVIAAFADRADDLLLSPLSGHWEPDLDRGGALTLIAAHVVVTQGFHVPRLVASLGEDGEVEMAVIAAPYAPPVEDVTLDEAAAVVAAVRADRRAQRALARLKLDTDSRARAALARLGVRD